jgi:hypothetical protein
MLPRTAKNHSIRVIRLCPPDIGDRFEVESEANGYRWSISRERVARIFGESSRRGCACYPLNAGAETTDTTVEVEALTHAAEAAPATPEPQARAADAEVEPDAEEVQPPEESAAPPDESADPTGDDERRAGRPEVRTERSPAAAQQTIFREESAQGVLF